jgi:hypothetical protein
MVYEVQGHYTSWIGGNLRKIKQALLIEFQKLKFESQCITKIKEINYKVGESMWDYDQI